MELLDGSGTDALLKRKLKRSFCIKNKTALNKKKKTYYCINNNKHKNKYLELNLFN